MASHQVGIKSVPEFMQTIWQKPKESSLTRIFRGQAKNWPLLPRLFRAQKRQKELRELEYLLLSEFQARCLYLLPSVPEGQYDMMSLAQHYGLPTRLLDWSSNPLMALFFALDAMNPPAPTVYIYDGSQFDANNPQIPVRRSLNDQFGIRDQQTTVILSPSRHSQRVVAQAGWHTVHRLGTNEDSVLVEPMNSLKDDSERLTILAIDPQRTKDIRIDLRDMGIHSATVYGDLSSVCREIENDLAIPLSMKPDLRSQDDA